MSIVNLVEDEMLGIVRSVADCKSGITWKELKVLAQRIFLLDVIHSLLLSGSTCTTRSIFYRSLTANSGLFNSAAAVSIQLLSLCDTLKVDRNALGIFATAKGLVASGGLSCIISKEEQVLTNLKDHPEGLLITASMVNADDIRTDCKTCLIVEKDTVFNVRL